MPQLLSFLKTSHFVSLKDKRCTVHVLSYSANVIALPLQSQRRKRKQLFNISHDSIITYVQYNKLVEFAKSIPQ